jgi:hypothetical protein
MAHGSCEGVKRRWGLTPGCSQKTHHNKEGDYGQRIKLIVLISLLDAIVSCNSTRTCMPKATSSFTVPQPGKGVSLWWN